MKVLFYDVDDFELECFLKNSFKLIEPYFFKTRLNVKTYVDKKYLDTEALSIFIESNLNKETLAEFKNLKYIFVRSTGYSNVDLKYCKQKGIKIFNVPDYGTNSVAEFAFGLILNVSKNILKASLKLKEGYIDKKELIGFELNSKTIGVIGAGLIGKRILDMAKAFNMNPIAFDVHKEADYNYVSLNELLEKSDFIVICCPLNDSTRYMINHNAFLKMKKEAFLINISRGEIIETESLYDAIANKKIKGAALDVVECEQTLCKLYKECSKDDNIKSNCIKKYLFTSKLMQMENIIITPHIAYNTFEAREKIVNTTLYNIKSSFNINYGTKNLILI